MSDDAKAAPAPAPETAEAPAVPELPIEEEVVRRKHWDLIQQAQIDTTKRFVDVQVNFMVLNRLSVLELQNLLWSALDQDKRTHPTRSPLSRLASPEEREACVRLQRLPFELYRALLECDYRTSEEGASFWRLLSQIPYCLNEVIAVATTTPEAETTADEQTSQFIIALPRTEAERAVLMQSPFDPDAWLRFLRQNPQLQRRNERHQAETGLHAKDQVRWFEGLRQEVERDDDGIITANAVMQLPLPVPPAALRQPPRGESVYHQIEAEGAVIMHCDYSILQLVRSMVSMFHLEDMWLSSLREELQVLYLSAAEDMLTEEQKAKQEAEHLREKRYSRYLFEQLQVRRQHHLRLQIPDEIHRQLATVMKSVQDLGTLIHQFEWSLTKRKASERPPFNLARALRDHSRELMTQPSLFMTQLANDIMQVQGRVIAHYKHHITERAFQRYLREETELTPEQCVACEVNLLLWAQRQHVARRRQEMERYGNCVRTPGAAHAFIAAEQQADSKERQKQRRRKKKTKEKKAEGPEGPEEPGAGVTASPETETDEVPCPPDSPLDDVPDPPPSLARQLSAELPSEASGASTACGSE